MKTKELMEIQRTAIMSLDRDDQMLVLRSLCASRRIKLLADKYACETPDEQMRRYSRPKKMITKNYAELCAGYAPRIIRTADEFDRATAAVTALAAHALTTEQDDYLDLVSQLILRYQDRGQLTEIQGRALQFFVEHYTANCRAPSYRDVAGHIGKKTAPIKRLERMGYLEQGFASGLQPSMLAMKYFAKDAAGYSEYDRDNARRHGIFL